MVKLTTQPRRRLNTGKTKRLLNQGCENGLEARSLKLNPDRLSTLPEFLLEMKSNSNLLNLSTSSNVIAKLLKLLHWLRQMAD